MSVVRSAQDQGRKLGALIGVGIVGVFSGFAASEYGTTIRIHCERSPSELHCKVQEKPLFRAPRTRDLALSGARSARVRKRGSSKNRKRWLSLISTKGTEHALTSKIQISARPLRAARTQLNGFFKDPALQEVSIEVGSPRAGWNFLGFMVIIFGVIALVVIVLRWFRPPGSQPKNLRP